MSSIGQSRIHAITPERLRSGALSGLAAGTRILTLEGELPVEHLEAGDRIVTRNGARVLRRVSVHTVRSGYRIRPNVLGQGRPEVEVVVGPGQDLWVRDWRAKALFGAARAAIPVSRLADGRYIAPTEAPVRLWRLEFDTAEVIYAEGIEVVTPAPVAATI